MHKRRFYQWTNQRKWLRNDRPPLLRLLDGVERRPNRSCSHPCPWWRCFLGIKKLVSLNKEERQKTHCHEENRRRIPFVRRREDRRGRFVWEVWTPLEMPFLLNGGTCGTGSENPWGSRPLSRRRSAGPFFDSRIWKLLILFIGFINGW